jgi:1-acyl-sn-glycerol-3-phosphate acyltransferase
MSQLEAGTLVWSPPVWREILRWPLPFQGPGTRLLLKTVAMFARRHVKVIYGLEHMRPGLDPFILVSNHSSRREALLVPPLIMFHRGGRLIHFLADWNFRLIPGVGLIYRRGGVITVTHKPARPAFLNVFKPLYTDPVPPFERARKHLEAGRSVGVFPEGTTNPNPERLLTGRLGAARLSLETGVPVMPMGIRFPAGTAADPTAGAMEIHIGAPLRPPVPEPGPAPLEKVRDWHAKLMTEIARLSGKSWTQGANRP